MRRRRLLLILGGLGGLLVLGGVAVFRLADAASDLRQGERAVDAASTALIDGRIGDARESLADAERAVLDANATLQSSISLDVLGLLPGVQQNLEALTDSVEIAATVVHGGQRILATTDELEGPDGTLQVSLSAGSIPLDGVRDARSEVRALLDQLGEVDDDEGSALLLPATRELRRTVAAEAIHRRAQLDRVDRGLTLLNELVGGDRPRRYLLAVANTAEMRGTGGMMLNYGVLEGADGGVDLTAFGRVDELMIATAQTTEDAGLPADYARRWKGFDITREWRNATMSGDFTLVAPVLAQMYERATGLRADGVIQVDPAGLAAILQSVGPVTVPELGEVDAENVEALVLNEAYRRFPDVQERTDVLGDVAEAAFRRLVDGDFASVRSLAEPLVDAVDGRHVMVHSDTPRVGSVIASFGADGSLPDVETKDYAHLTVQNMSGNKLDYYVDTGLAVRGRRPGGEIGSWGVDITLTNTAPVGERTPRYIFGPFEESFTAGTYRAAVTLYLPEGTSLESASDTPYRLEPSLQTEDGRPLVGFWIDVPAGQSRTVSLDLRMAPRPPDETYELLLVPSARVRPTTASVRIETDDGTAVAEVVLDRPWVVNDLGPARPISGV